MCYKQSEIERAGVYAYSLLYWYSAKYVDQCTRGPVYPWTVSFFYLLLPPSNSIPRRQAVSHASPDCVGNDDCLLGLEPVERRLHPAQPMVHNVLPL